MTGILQTILLVAVFILIVQWIFILSKNSENQLLTSKLFGFERALKISKNKLADAERERQWLNNQIDMILLDIKEGRDPVHPRFQPSWEYRYDNILDPRD